MIGTYLMDRAGRKRLCVFACVGMIITIFIVYALTKRESLLIRVKIWVDITQHHY